MSKHIPLISSSLAGPLGVLHLPRLWQKVSLEETGQLHSDYPGIGKGFDSLVLGALKIDADAIRAFIRDNAPSYIECENWVAENGTLNLSEVSRLNRQISQYHHDDATRKGILEAAGLDDSVATVDAPSLNNLDDWTGFHREVILNRASAD